MVKMNVDLGDRGYPIYIASDFSGLDRACGSARLGGKFVIIADSNVERHYCQACTDELSKFAKEISCHTFPAGEQNKNLETVSDIYRKLISLKLDRNSTLVALGGGVTGDITGFAAATYLRGIPFIQIPTSLLAQADSSIGGKTGVDFEGSKNMIGAFYQPRFVFINVNTLRTLPGRELRSGLAEVIKHGLIMNAEFYDYIDYNIDKIYSFDENTLQYVTKMNCTIKGGVIEQDEREEGMRAILNFGHTIGHAVESVSGFKLLHGECVSIGMAGAFRLARKLGMVSDKSVVKVEGTLIKAGLPVKITGMDTDSIMDMMYLDKKVRDGRLYFILPREIGEVLGCHVDDTEMVKQVIEELSREDQAV
ncbi:MAG TPA: 3-dehydroquinate synthase [Clostridia bacterium]|nr:3-dehydroquinate synthase [Clostridia bacterium]